MTKTITGTYYDPYEHFDERIFNSTLKAIQSLGSGEGKTFDERQVIKQGLANEFDVNIKSDDDFVQLTKEI